MSRRRSAARRGSEESLVRWLRDIADPGIGDDAAFARLDGELAFTVDAQHEGVHLPLGIDPAIAARRLLAVNLSDLAAVGAEPRVALLSLAAPDGYDRRRFLRALVEAAALHRVRLLGGDSSRSATLSATLTLVGRRRPGSHWLRRSGARPGDAVYAGGSLGEAALGLALLERGASWVDGRPRLPPGFEAGSRLRRAAVGAVKRNLLPEPQLRLSRRLAGSRRRVAAIDVSDGLGKDLARLCAASGVGAVIDRLPLPPFAEELANRLDLDVHELALGGGEDYVLLFASAARELGKGCERIGWITEGASVVFVDEDGRRRDIADAGYDHLRGSGSDRARGRGA